MDPQIQFVTTADDVRIAYWTLGSGPPLLVAAPLVASHVSIEWRIGALASWYQRLASVRTVVRWDWRGSGLSDRGLPLTDDAAGLDVDSVLGVVPAGPVDAIVAPGGMNESLIAYAGNRPDALGKLVLISPILRGRSTAENPQYRAVRSLLDHDLYAWSEVHARLALGWGTEDPRVHAWAGMIQAARSREDWIRFTEYFEGTDYSQLLQDVNAETLIIHSSNRPIARKDAREAAAKIPNARLVDIDPGGTLAWYEKEELTGAIDEFLAIPRRDPVRSSAHGTAVILFTDIADSTGLTERLGDDVFRAAARELEAQLRSAITGANGIAAEGRLLGDGVMATFGAASDAILAAERCRRLTEGSILRLHIGVHAGDVIHEGNDVHGGAVNIAARICSLCDPGEVLVSQTVRDLARTSAGATFDDRGAHVLKGVADPVRVFAVRHSA